VKGTAQEAFYFHRDIHLNPRGYTLWAKAQLAVLLNPASQLLPAAFY
jgi:hypothetical protein